MSRASFSYGVPFSLDLGSSYSSSITYHQKMHPLLGMQALVVSLSLLPLVFGIAAQSASFAEPVNSREYEPVNSREYVMYKSTYSRSEEVQGKCSSYLSDLSHSPPSALDPDVMKWALLNELTFLNGDWQQRPGDSPLIPFIPSSSNSSEVQLNNKESQEAVVAMAGAARLASLWITDVDLDPHKTMASPHTINVSAILQLGTSSERTLSYMGSNLQGFQICPGFSMLSIAMEGIYAELQSGQRLLCMVGSAHLPSRGKNASMPWDWLDLVTREGAFSPPSSDDSKIFAVFHFPRTLSLTTRAVSGQLLSFHAPTHPNYFNPIDISSQLGPYSNYQFVSGDLVGSACESSQHFPGEIQPPLKIFRGNGSLCVLAQQLLAAQWMDLMPNWNCSLSKDICIKLGPFTNKDSTSQLMDGGFNGTRLLVRDIRCVDYIEDDGSYSANISAVLRAVLPSQNQHIAFERTGLDGLTLAAEGKWSSSSGQMCMVGCRGGDSGSDTSSKEACESKICVYVPLSFSLRQRSILQGSISSIHNISDYFYPLSFIQPLHPTQLPRDVVGKLAYEYTKIAEAGALLEKSEPVGFGEKIKKSLFKYPSANGNFLSLFEDLSVHSLAITNPMKGPHVKQAVSFDILAIEDLVGVDWLQISEFVSMAPTSAIDDETEKVEEQQNSFKVAAQLAIKDNLENNVITVSVEGEYDPTVGRMFMIGCREVNAPWMTFHENAELLEDGLDCLMEVRIEYPPTNARWFMNPAVMVTVTSSRTEDDPLFFPTIELETYPILYKRQREEIVSRKSLGGGLSILTLSLILGCIISQLIYVKSHADSTPYISMLMLAIQAVGFSIPLITGMEALFAKMTSDAEDIKGSVLSEGRWTQVIGYIVKLLTLVAFLLTLRIVQKVIKSRIRLGTRRPLELWRVPNDKRVLAICSVVHGIGFITVWIIYSIRISQHPFKSSFYMDWRGDVHKQHDWERVLLEYYGMVQDLFLLPQVVGNHLWEVKGKPLRMIFYVGVTVLRLLPHVYDSLRSPVFNPYFADEFQYANPSSDFYSKAADIAIPLLAVVLAIVVYIQQRWNGLKWERVIRQGSDKLMRMGSKLYERLPSKTFEAEMVEAPNPESLENDCTGNTAKH